MTHSHLPSRAASETALLFSRLTQEPLPASSHFLKHFWVPWFPLTLTTPKAEGGMGVGVRSPASLPVPFYPVTTSQGATRRIINRLWELTFPGPGRSQGHRQGWKMLLREGEKCRGYNLEKMNEQRKKSCYALFELMKREKIIFPLPSHVMYGSAGVGVCACARLSGCACAWRPEDKLCCWAMPSVIFGTGYLAVCSPGWLADQFPGILLFQGFTPPREFRS